jgi:CBS domain-containing protein
MDDVVRFLAEQAPFGTLPPEALAASVSKLQIEFFPRDARLPSERAPFVYILRTGAVEVRSSGTLVARVGEGDCVEAALWGDGPHEVVAVEDTLAYLLPRESFEGLLCWESFARFFRGGGEALAHALWAGRDQAGAGMGQVRSIALLPAVFCHPQDTIAEAALRMRECDASCVVVLAEPPAILTDRDLRNEVVAGGMPVEAPVSVIMTPVPGLPEETTLVEALVVMMERGVSHLPVLEGGRVVGLLTDRDLIQAHAPSPLLLGRVLSAPDNEEGLAEHGRQARLATASLWRAGWEPSAIGKVMALSHDHLVRHLIAEARRVLGAPPCPFCWLVPDSLGREEPSLFPMQAHAIAHEDGMGPTGAAWFARLAQFVSDGLTRAGFRENTKQMVATNPLWCRPVAVWRRYFDDWAIHPDTSVAAQAGPFFDARAVAGDLDIRMELLPALRAAGAGASFRSRLARLALAQQPPLGFFRGRVLEKDGSCTDVLDLNQRVLDPIVRLARLASLQAGQPCSSTVLRLRMSTTDSFLSAGDSDALVVAYEWASKTRLERQLAVNSSTDSADVLDPASLSSEQRAGMVECFHILASALKSLDTMLGGPTEGHG